MSKKSRIMAVILVAVLMVTGFIMPEKATGAGLALTATDLWMSAWAAYCASHGMANTFEAGGVPASISNPMSSADVTELVEDLIDRYANANNLSLTLENWAQLLDSSLSVTANTGSGTVLHVAASEVGMFDAFADWVLGNVFDMSRTESGFSHSGGSFGDVSSINIMQIDGVDGMPATGGTVLGEPIDGSKILRIGSGVQYNFHLWRYGWDLYFVSDSPFDWTGIDKSTDGVNWQSYTAVRALQKNSNLLNGDYYIASVSNSGMGNYVISLVPELSGGITANSSSDKVKNAIDLGATDANAGVIGIPDTTDQDYVPDAISVPLNQPWDDAYAGENGLAGALQGIMDKVRSNTIALAGEGTDDPGGGSSGDPDDYQALGLADVFPFCLPFDLYNFFACLGADPVAPSFEVPINFPPLNYSYTFEIDLSAFNTVAAILRKMELLGFCVALILISRQKLLRG